ncbi:MAG: hypothetical protein JW891_09495 [Candidatus Lokiarchaeota archaeon]|nr:hypothetical protein [Candidatus Lokiarchaeota archaeon]
MYLNKVGINAIRVIKYLIPKKSKTGISRVAIFATMNVVPYNIEVEIRKIIAKISLLEYLLGLRFIS